MDKGDLAGSWTLARVEFASDEDSEANGKLPYGDKPQGVIHYLPDGRMAVFLQASDRAPIAGGRRGGSEAEWAAAMRGFTAYAGTYELRGERVIHHVEFNNYPNDIGVPYERIAKLTGDRLTLETPPDRPAGDRHLRLIWQRLGTSG